MNVAPLPKLQEPASSLIFEQSNFEHPNSRHEWQVMSRPFNYAMDVFVSKEFSQFVKVEELSTFYEATLPIHVLLHPAFLEAFIRRGVLQMCSIQNHIDTDDTMCVTPTGDLFVHLTQDSYQKLGLTARKSKYAKKSHLQKHLVHIPLSADYFVPGKRLYERARKCFETNHQKVYRVLFIWQPHDTKVSPSSVSLFLKKIGCPCDVQDNIVSSFYHPQHGQHVDIDPSQPDPADGSHSDYIEVYDWIGMIANEIDMSQFIAEVGNETIESKPDYFCQKVKGFLRSSAILAVLEKLRKLAEQRNTMTGITVYGMVDSPVCVDKQEHNVICDDGDNSYTFLCFPDGTYWFYNAIASYDGD